VVSTDTMDEVNISDSERPGLGYGSRGLVHDVLVLILILGVLAAGFLRASTRPTLNQRKSTIGRLPLGKCSYDGLVVGQPPRIESTTNACMSIHQNCKSCSDLGSSAGSQ